MAVGNSTNATFYSISNGKICRQFTSPDDETKERTNMNGKVVHEKFYDFIDGQIVDITTKESDYGKSWIVTLIDEGGSYQLQMPYSSGYASAFLKTLPNVDLSKPVKLIPKLEIVNDKKKTTLFVTQGGSPVKWFYTKEHPNDMPTLVKKRVKGKDVWDDSDMMEFLDEMVENEIKPKLRPAQVYAKPAPVRAGTSASKDEVENDDGLPF